MKLAEFMASKRPCADLRTIDDSPYGRNQNDELRADAVEGFLYAGSYAIEQCGADNGFSCLIQFERGSPDLYSLELELFYYYGRHVGADAELTLFDRLDMALHQSDLDAACRYIQDGLGQDDGGLAGQFFSGCEAWADLTPADRLPLLGEYIGQELSGAGWAAIESRQPQD